MLVCSCVWMSVGFGASAISYLLRRAIHHLNSCIPLNRVKHYRLENDDCPTEQPEASAARTTSDYWPLTNPLHHHGAIAFYESLGFRLTGERAGGELVMRVQR